MTLQEVMSQLEAMGSESCKRIFINHGATEPLYGVKVQDLKKIQKQVKKDYQLSMQLFSTGNSDAMYLAALIADPQKMTKADLEAWVEKAHWHMISECAVAPVAADSQHGLELGFEWIKSEYEHTAAAGWATLGAIASRTDIPVEEFSVLIDAVQQRIHKAQNRVKYAMNSFLISVGTYVEPLAPKALKAAEAIGKVSVNMGATSCKVPLAKEYILKSRDRVKGKKKKAMC